MDGFQVAKEMTKINPNLFIIGLTGHSNKEYQEKCRSAGMRFMVTKPITKN